jgi:hypothetical protein
MNKICPTVQVLAREVYVHTDKQRGDIPKITFCCSRGLKAYKSIKNLDSEKFPMTILFQGNKNEWKRMLHEEILI